MGGPQVHVHLLTRRQRRMTLDGIDSAHVALKSWYIDVSQQMLEPGLIRINTLFGSQTHSSEWVSQSMSQCSSVIVFPSLWAVSTGCRPAPGYTAEVSLPVPGCRCFSATFLGQHTFLYFTRQSTGPGIEINSVETFFWPCPSSLKTNSAPVFNYFIKRIKIY